MSDRVIVMHEGRIKGEITDVGNATQEDILQACGCLKFMNWKKILSDYGTLLVLILLCAGFSIVTLEEQWPTDAGAAKKVVAQQRHRV